jgi:hypothetical protein
MAAADGPDEAVSEATLRAFAARASASAGLSRLVLSTSGSPPEHLTSAQPSGRWEQDEQDGSGDDDARLTNESTWTWEHITRQRCHHPAQIRNTSATIEPDATVPTPWRLQTHRPCAVCKEDREKACYSGNQWKRPSIAVCKECLAAQQAMRTGPDGKTLPEFMPGGASYCPGVKTARNERRQKAARSLPLRKNGQPPRFDAEDVRELAASKGVEMLEERRQQHMKEEEDARTAALGAFADLGL